MGLEPEMGPSAPPFEVGGGDAVGVMGMGVGMGVGVGSAPPLELLEDGDEGEGIPSARGFMSNATPLVPSAPPLDEDDPR